MHYTKQEIINMIKCKKKVFELACEVRDIKPIRGKGYTKEQLDMIIKQTSMMTGGSTGAISPKS